MIKRIVAVLALVLGLVGCAGLPTSGPVEEVELPEQAQGIEVAPEPPIPGVAPERLIEGFLQAMADPSDDYAVAREYLVESAALVWNPTTAVIYRGSVSADTHGATISGDLLGELSPQGRYTARHGQFSFDFKPVLVDGEWRISNPPSGLLVSSYIFDRYYAEISVYFMARVGTHVVPDLVHVPEQQLAPNAIVAAMLRGPGKSLQDTVINAAPSTLELGPAGASMDAQGVVTVDFLGLSGELSDDARRRLGTQLVWSLTSLPRFTGLKVTNDAMPYSMPGSNEDGVLELSSQQGYQVLSRGSSPDLFAVRDGVAGKLDDDGQLTPVEPAMRGVADLALSLDGVSVAYLNQARTELVMGSIGGELTTVPTGLTNLRAPQYVLGTLYLLGDDDGVATLVTVDRAHRVQRVRIDLPEDAQILTFAVSPTQTKLALVLEVNGEAALGLAPLLPDGITSGAWTRLPLVTSNGKLLTDVHAVTWHAELTMAVLANASSSRSVFTAQVDGSLVEELGPVGGDMDGIAAMARLGGGNLAVRTGEGNVWGYEARTRWTLLGQDITAIAYSS